MTESLLTLICSPSLERPLIDWLLEKDDIQGFTSSHAYGHGSDPDKLSLREQVEGRKKQVVINIHMDSESAMLVINDLRKDFKGAKIHYWLVPVIASGNLSGN